MIKKLITTKCELLVSSDETVQVAPGLVYLEFLCGENTDCMENLLISECPDLFRYTLKDDGLYMYYRLAIYTKDYLGTNYTNKFYYDPANNKLMLGDSEITTSSQLEAIVDDVKTEYSIIEIVEEPVFSICKLSHCLFNYQRQFIFNGCMDGKLKCNDKDTDEFARNFLFSSVFVLRQLIRQQRYEEALRILKSVEGCGGLCNDTKSVVKPCNCYK